MITSRPSACSSASCATQASIAAASRPRPSSVIIALAITIPWAGRLCDRLPLHRTILLVSGRASFELTQKALLAGIPILAAVSAPSSLAVELAEQSGLTLIGFLREDSMNIYAHPERVLARDGAATAD